LPDQLHITVYKWLKIYCHKIRSDMYCIHSSYAVTFNLWHKLPSQHYKEDGFVAHLTSKPTSTYPFPRANQSSSYSAEITSHLSIFFR